MDTAIRDTALLGSLLLAHKYLGKHVREWPLFRHFTSRDLLHFLYMAAVVMVTALLC